MEMPDFDSGLHNFYEAHLTEGVAAQLDVLTVPIDYICLDRKIYFIKIDAQGHERSVLAGLQQVIAKYRPTLLVETGGDDVIASVKDCGYRSSRVKGSANVLFQAV